MTRALAVRLDSMGDVLLMGPALRAMAADVDRLDVLTSPGGAAAAAALLPGVDEVLSLAVPWSGRPAPEFSADLVDHLVHRLARRRYDEVVIFTSYHQSALPMALVARLAGATRVIADCDDYPGSLLDVRHRRMADGSDDDGGSAGGHEVSAALALVAAAGHRLPAGDDGSLALRAELPAVPALLGPAGEYVVVHPGASAPARAIESSLAAAVARCLELDDGWTVVVTGGPGEALAASEVTPPGGILLAGRTTVPELAAVLRDAAAVVVGNTGPAHLAAAVGTPVVSLFAPVVPVQRWGPWHVRSVVLGDQQSPCAGSRAIECPVPGHPCLGEVTPARVAAAVRTLTGRPGRLRRWAS